MRRNSFRPGTGLAATNRPELLSQSHHDRLDHSSASDGPQRGSAPLSSIASRRRRRPASASAFAASAAILVSSVLVSSPAMIAPAAARYIPSDGSTASPSVYQYAFAARQTGTHSSPSVSGSSSQVPLGIMDKEVPVPSSSIAPAPSQPALSPSHQLSSASSMDDIDDHLPQDLGASTLHRQYARQYDDEPALFGERDVSTTLDSLQRDAMRAPNTASAYNMATQSAHRYSLPSTYPSSIASSWSRPERSVWFQQKAIIITSIFLAIFIVLFIGAAVFLRERKFDDELAGLDDEEALARIEERMTMGRFSDPSEKDSGSPGTRLKRKLRIGRKRSEKDGTDATDPSSGSSSAVKRKRHLVSRWTRTNLRDSNDTMRGTSDTASIRSGRSGRRAVLGDPRAQESVEVTYDSDGVEISRANGTSDDAMPSAQNGTAGSANGSTTINDDTSADASTTNRPRSPPPPHPDSAQRHTDSSSSEGRSAFNPDIQGNSTVEADSSLRSPRRVLLDDSDFQAADAAEGHHDDMRHMPPAYIPSGSGGMSGSSYDGAALAAALSRGDAKNGIPPPEERDPTVSSEVIGAVLAEAPAASRQAYEPTGPTAAHIATDDKAVLGALSAAASMPSAPAVDRETSAPAYGAPEELDAGGSSASGAQHASASGPSAPALEMDGDGFEVAPAEAVASGSSQDRLVNDEKRQGKGKAKQVATASLLPAPPTAIETVFSPFDQPYRATSPPGATVPPSTPGRVSPLGRRSTDASVAAEAMTPRKSEKQKEAEQEQLAQLVASRPEDALDAPRYERHGPSAPPLAEPDSSETMNVASRSTEHLPAYEQRRRSSAAAAQLGLIPGAAPSAPSMASAPSAPSAPHNDDDEEQ